MTLVVATRCRNTVHWESDLFWGNEDGDFCLLAGPKFISPFPGLVLGGSGDLGFFSRVVEAIRPLSATNTLLLLPDILRETLEAVPEDSGIIGSWGTSLFELATNFEILHVQSGVGDFVATGSGAADYRKISELGMDLDIFTIISAVNNSVQGYAENIYGPF